ncbi:hypothetical protein CR513_63035, partial [Mucuna pruriens]
MNFYKEVRYQDFKGIKLQTIFVVFLRMGYYCYKRKAYSTHTSDVVLMLAVALMLLGIPWLFAREQVVVVEEKKMNYSALVTPILSQFRTVNEDQFV